MVRIHQKPAMSKINIQDISYDNVLCDLGWVRNLEYPVSQKDLNLLCKRLPRFYNSMGELYLLNADQTAWFHNYQR